MASLTIRNLDDDVKTGLRLRAARHGHSMEEEARQILKKALQSAPQEIGLGSRIHARFAAEGGVDVPVPRRMLPRPPPDLSNAD